MKTFPFIVMVMILVAGLIATLSASEMEFPRQSEIMNSENVTQSGITKGQFNWPLLRWEYYAERNLMEDEPWFGDVDDDGINESAIVINGTVVLKNNSEKVLWKSDIIDASEILGLYDVDENDQMELVVACGYPISALILLDVKNGDVLWHFKDLDEKSAKISNLKNLYTEQSD